MFHYSVSCNLVISFTKSGFFHFIINVFMIMFQQLKAVGLMLRKIMFLFEYWKSQHWHGTGHVYFFNFKPKPQSFPRLRAWTTV